MRPILPKPLLRIAAVGTAAAVLAAPVQATWSIVVLNRVTGEVAVATSTCIQNFDIATAVPVIRVGYAAGAAQSFVLGNASNRRRIYRNSLRGATPQQLLDLIEASDGGFANRQFGIVTFTGPPVTHTGTSNGAAASGVTGELGPYQYAIQGNVLTGDNVVLDCEAAFLAEPGDMGQKIIAAMEAARDAGGDGRCSCSNSAPTSCGSPPQNFTYASYNAFMAIARLGDTDGACFGSTGCAAGDYYLRLNYVGSFGAQEPIENLRVQYDAWRTAQVGRPDHVLSEVQESLPLLQADGLTTNRVTIRLRDVDGNALAVGGQTVTVTRVDGDAVAIVSGLVDHGDGTHSFDLVATTTTGAGTYRVVVDDGVRPVQLYPDLEVESVTASELHIGVEAYSAGEGTQVPIVVNRAHGGIGATYRVLASLAGTVPGTTVGGVLVPLNRDRLFDMSLGWPGGEPFDGSFGVLDNAGRAEARFSPDAGALTGFVGRTLSFSAIVGGQSATAPASITIGS